MVSDDIFKQASRKARSINEDANAATFNLLGTFINDENLLLLGTVSAVTNLIYKTVNRLWRTVGRARSLS